MHRRLMAIPVTSALAAALLGLSFPAGASAGRTLAGVKKQPVAVGTGGAVASMSLGASQAGIDVLPVAATPSTPRSRRPPRWA